MHKLKAPLSEEMLINELQAKSSAGAGALYDNYSGALFGILLAMVSNKELAGELLQQSFIKIWESFDDYNVSKGRLFPWMVGITRNLVKVSLQGEAVGRQNATLPASANGYKNPLAATVCTNAAGPCYGANKTNEGDHDIFKLIFYKGYTCADAAKELDISLDAAKKHCRAALFMKRGQ